MLRNMLRILAMAMLLLVIVVSGGGMAFLRRPVAVAYLGLWAVWGFSTMLLRPAGERSSYDQSQKVALGLLGVLTLPLLLIGPAWEYARFNGPLPRDGAIAWIGIGIFALSIALQAWAMCRLSGLYTVRLGIQPGHKLVTTGPYRLVRHPGYLGFILSVMGIALALGSLAALAYEIIAVGFILWRIRREEAMLAERFGEEYKQYARKTRRLVPFLY